MKRFTAVFLSLFLAFTSSADALARPQLQEVNANPPASPVRLIFIHHSTGENWLNDENGGLARALQENNYFPSDTNYGWGPDAIGDRTDIPNWVDWFSSPIPAVICKLYFRKAKCIPPSSAHWQIPVGKTQVILFKSCFPNSALAGNPDDPPAPGST